MSLNINISRNVSPSGVGLAYLDVPQINPKENISIIDESYKWPENVASIDTAILEAFIDTDGSMPTLTVGDFVLTNIKSDPVNDKQSVPLYYKHTARFHHYSYGDNPTKHIYITDQDGNIMNNVNYKILANRVTANVYTIDILTDVVNNGFIQYKAKYNRCFSDGSDIRSSWTENLNPIPLFRPGVPLQMIYEYALSGPDDNGAYTVIVPPVPTISKLFNSTGFSFERAPTILKHCVTNTEKYQATVRYTIKATGSTTFTVRRNTLRDGSVTSDIYLQSLTTDTWSSSSVNFNIGSNIIGIPGVDVSIYDDKYLIANDETYFDVSPSYYYLNPISYKALYLGKPDSSTVEDDWLIKVRNGTFRRYMDEQGAPLPSGFGQTFEYRLPEYKLQLFNTTYDEPYMTVQEERATVVDKNIIRLKKVPLFIDPSGVLNNVTDPGFPSADIITLKINDQQIDQSSIYDWDVENGTIRVATSLRSNDDVVAQYIYKENFYNYNGFVGSGGIYPTVAPFPYFDLDLNPTTSHNPGFYGSGMVAHIFLKPYVNISTGQVLYSNNTLYHNYTGTASGVYDFKLGQVSVNRNSIIDDISLTDTRRRGGGLNQRAVDSINDVIDVQPEAQFFWDLGYFDGKAVPTNGVVIVNVPKTVLESNGGVMTSDEVRQKVLKHLALGCYPIINYT